MFLNIFKCLISSQIPTDIEAKWKGQKSWVDFRDDSTY